MKKYLVLFGCFVSFLVFPQKGELNRFRVMFYNCENFFDCKDDSLTNDSEYLPGGLRGWNYERYQKKQNNIGRVISSIGGWNCPALVGLCEVENDNCLRDLTRYSGLKNLSYKSVHYESPDARGIDVALLYQADQFKVLESRAIRINYLNDPKSKTRDILFVKGMVPTADTLFVFVCHFPSRLGGELESEGKRLFVANRLRLETDSIFRVNPAANIVIMGDFNDYPENKSISEVLGAKSPNNIESGNLYNMMLPLINTGRGTHKFNADWGILDQLIVSANLLIMTNNFRVLDRQAEIYDAPFLLVDDVKFLGKEPNRTYNGAKYNGGYSDHLPVFLDFWF